MKRNWLSLFFLLLGCPAFAQEPIPAPGGLTESRPVFDSVQPPTPILDSCCGKQGLHDYLKGDREFSRFIGFGSNPSQNIDPRALTQIIPVFGDVRTSGNSPLPSTDVQAYGPLLSIAIGERFSFGLNRGAYAVATTNRDRDSVANRPDLFARFQRDRTGFLDLGGYFQYALVRDVPNQFLLTAGLQWMAPTGSSALFQGSGPGYLTPYLTAAKEYGEFHVMATTGYQFPARSAESTINLFYGNIHFDRRCFGWLYPLVEFNWAYHTNNTNINIATNRGTFDLGTFSSSGNLLTVAPGVNAVLLQNRLELGAVYERPIASQRNIDFNAVIVKMVIRY